MYNAIVSCFFAEGWRDSVLGAPRRLLVTLGSLSRDSSPCPAAVSHRFVHPLSTKLRDQATIFYLLYGKARYEQGFAMVDKIWKELAFLSFYGRHDAT